MGWVLGGGGALRRGLRLAQSLSAASVGVLVCAGGWSVLAGLSGVVPGGLEPDSTYDVLRAIAVSNGDLLPLYGVPSWGDGVSHPGPVSYWAMSLGVLLGGSSAASVTTAIAYVVGVLVVGALAVSSALVAYRAGAAAALAQVAALVLLYQGRMSDAHAQPGALWVPALAAVAVFLLAQVWGLIRDGRWALPFVACLACVAGQLYLPAAPAAAVVLATVLAYLWKFRRSRTQRPYVVAAWVVVATGVAFFPARLVVEGPSELATRLLGLNGSEPFAYSGDAVWALSSTMGSYAWLSLLPLVGLPVGALVMLRAPRASLLGPLGSIVAASAALTLALQISLIVALNRPLQSGDQASATWPAQAATVSHAASLAVLVLTGFVLLAAWLATKPHRLTLAGGVLLAASSSAVVACVVAGALVFSWVEGPSLRAQPWSGAGGGHGDGADLLAAQKVVPYLDPDGVTLVTALLGPSSEYRPGPSIAGLVAIESALVGPTCASPTVARRMSYVVPECQREKLVQVVTVVDPSWPRQTDLPGTAIGSVESRTGTVVLTVSSPEQVHAWLQRQPLVAENVHAGADAYCDVVSCGWNDPQQVSPTG